MNSEKWKLDLCPTSLRGGTVSISGRAIPTGNCNCLGIESNGNWVVPTQDQQRAR